MSRFTLALGWYTGHERFYGPILPLLYPKDTNSKNVGLFVTGDVKDESWRTVVVGSIPLKDIDG